MDINGCPTGTVLASFPGISSIPTGVSPAPCRYSAFWIEREMDKAFVGFVGAESISTGGWGCGQFGGDPALKFAQQLLAASAAGVERVEYNCFGNAKTATTLQRLCKEMEGQTIAAVHGIMLNYEGHGTGVGTWLRKVGAALFAQLPALLLALAATGLWVRYNAPDLFAAASEAAPVAVTVLVCIVSVLALLSMYSGTGSGSREGDKPGQKPLFEHWFLDELLVLKRAGTPVMFPNAT